MSDLYALHSQVYRDKKIPKGRGEITAALDKRLKALPERARARALGSLSNIKVGPTDTYSRWIDLISKGSRK
jgi:hypothetical protein